MLRIKNDKHVLFLQPHQLIVFSSGQSGVRRRWPIVDNELPDELSVYLLANNRAVFDLLIDLAEEECHLEALPAIGRRDKKHYIERMREKYFPNAMLSSAVGSQKKASSVLVSGITHNALCTNLLNKLEGTESILKAIHSPVTLAPKIFKVFGLNTGAQLVVLRLDKSTFRLLACVNAFVVLNRRVEHVESTDKDISDELVTSISETLIYLDRKQIAGWVSPKVSFIEDYAGDSIFSDGLKGVLGSDSRFEFEHVFPSVGGIAKRKLKEFDAAKNSNGGFLAAMVGYGPKGYERFTHKRVYLRSKVRHICLALSLCILGGAVSTAALARKVSDQYAALSQRYDRSTDLAKNRLNDTGLDTAPSVEAVRQALVTAKFAEIRARQLPMPFLSQLSTAVGTQSTISLAAVSWERQDLLDEKSLQRVLGQGSVENELPIEMVYRATVEGVVKGSAGTALDTFDAFITVLRQTSANSKVVVIEAPFGLSQDAKTTALGLSGASGSFVIEVSTGEYLNEGS